MIGIYPPDPSPNPELPESLYGYREGPQFGPEAMGAIFDSFLGLPVFDLTEAGSLWSHGQGPNSIQEKPVAIIQSVPMAGLGGIQQGQFVTQGLQFEGE